MRVHTSIDSEHSEFHTQYISFSFSLSVTQFAHSTFLFLSHEWSVTLAYSLAYKSTTTTGTIICEVQQMFSLYLARSLAHFNRAQRRKQTEKKTILTHTNIMPAINWFSNFLSGILLQFRNGYKCIRSIHFCENVRFTISAFLSLLCGFCECVGFRLSNE